MSPATPRAEKTCLPKRFMLMPDEDSLRVVHAAQCIGHIWSEQNRWWARTQGGKRLDTPSQSVLEAVTALFDAQNRPTLLKAQ